MYVCMHHKQIQVHAHQFMRVCTSGLNVIPYVQLPSMFLCTSIQNYLCVIYIILAFCNVIVIAFMHACICILKHNLIGYTL